MPPSIHFTGSKHKESEMVNAVAARQNLRMCYSLMSGRYPVSCQLNLSNDQIMDIDQKIQDAFMQIARNKKRRRYLRLLKRTRISVENRRKELELIVEKEWRDVKRLESGGIPALFTTVLGSRSKQLEIERQEYLLAVLKYNEYVDCVNLIDFDISLLSAHIVDQSGLEAGLKKLLTQKEVKFRKTDRQFLTRIGNHDRKITKANVAWYNIEEAISAGKAARQGLHRLKKNLEATKSWGHWHYSGKGKLSSYRKVSYIDRARKNAVRTKLHLDKFEQEIQQVLTDLRIKDSFNIDSFEHFLDTFYDNLITDWIVKKRIANARMAIEAVIDKVNRLMATLNSEKRNADRELTRLNSYRQQLIIDAGMEGKSS